MSYANKGFESLAHLNFFNISLGTCLIFLPALICFFLAPRIHLLEDSADLFLGFGVLSTLSIYTFLRPDTPSNYYASRYFLPLLVPFVILLASRKMARFRAIVFWIMLTSALAFNAFYGGFLATSPSYRGRFDLARELSRIIPQDAVVFAAGDPYVHHLFANIVRYDVAARYGFLGTISDGALRHLPLVSEQFDSDTVFLVTDQPWWRRLDEVEETELTLRDKRYISWKLILYPYRSKAVEKRFYLYRVDNLLEKLTTVTADQMLTPQEIALLDPKSYLGRSAVPGSWSTGDLFLALPQPIEAGRIILETSGKLLSILGPSDVEIEIDGRKMTARLNTPTITVVLPARTGIHQIAVRSPTFVPRDMGINDDPRHLGIDLVRIVFE